jgi:hypothetical protein
MVPHEITMSTTEIVRSSIPQISAAAQRVSDLFRSMAVGDTVTYEMVNAAAGTDVRVKRYIADTARNRVLMSDSAHIATVHGIGYKRLNSREAADAVDSDMSRSRKAARRGLKKAQRVPIGDLPKDEQARHVMRTSLCMIVSESLGTKGRAKIEALACARPETMAALAQREALDALKAGG